MSLDIRVVIPSLGRAGKIDATVGLFDRPLLVVSEAEKRRYALIYRQTDILAHPGSLRGLGAVRQWVLDNVKNEIVFMVDDDVVRLNCIVGQRQRTIKNRDGIARVIENEAHIADQIGTPVFGFAHTSDVRHLRNQSPFSFTGWVSGSAMGVIGRQFRFDKNLITKSDIDFCLMVLLKKRALWRDLRFSFVIHSWFKSPGGQATIRTREIMEYPMVRAHGRFIEREKTNGKYLLSDLLPIRLFNRGTPCMRMPTAMTAGYISILTSMRGGRVWEL